MKLSGYNMYVRMLGFGSRANLASASASASAPGCPPNFEEEEMLSASPRAPASSSGETGLRTYVSSALLGPYVCLGNLTTTMFRLGPQQRINIGPGFGPGFGPGLGPGISAQVPGSIRARVDCRPFASAAGENRVTDPHHRHLSPYVRKHFGSSRFRASRGRFADKNTACSQDPHTRLELQPHQSRQGSG